MNTDYTRTPVVIARHAGNVLYYRSDIPPYVDKQGTPTHQRTFLLSESVFDERYGEIKS